jgi:hypothetical protein
VLTEMTAKTENQDDSLINQNALPICHSPHSICDK